MGVPMKNWRLLARCWGQGAVMYPEVSSGSRGKHLSPAQERSLYLCFDCPVRRECLTFALQGHEQDGTWGGTLQEERRGKTLADLDTLYATSASRAMRMGLMEATA